MINENLDIVKEQIQAKRNKLEWIGTELDKQITHLHDAKKALIWGPVTARDKKLWEMRTEFAILDQCEKWLQDFKKNLAKTSDYLKSDCLNIETRLFTTKQLVSREVEKGI